MADPLTTCIDLRWRYTLLIFVFLYVASWIVFAVVYYIISLIHEDFEWQTPNKSLGMFWKFWREAKLHAFRYTPIQSFSERMTNLLFILNSISNFEFWESFSDSDLNNWLNNCETLENNTCGNETLQACASDECLILNDCSTCLPDAIECVRKLKEYAAAASEDTCFSDIYDFTSAVLFR